MLSCIAAIFHMNTLEEINRYTTEDTTLSYQVDEAGIPSMTLYPSALSENIATHRQLINDEQGMRPLHEVFKTDYPACLQSNLVQLKIVGDPYPGGFSGGTTLTDSASTQELTFVAQRSEPLDDGSLVLTELANEKRGLKATHKLRLWNDQPFFESRIELENTSDSPITLELLASFCLGNLSPFQSDHGPEKYKIHRFGSTWSAEGRHERKSLEEHNLEKSWSGHGARSLRFGQTGSMPVKGWFPFVALEDSEHDVLWGAQIAHPGSWQLEVFRRSDQINISGGLADREFGHWMKTLQPGERFETPRAILSCCIGDIQDLANRMVRYQQLDDASLPKSEQTLPVIFNDWCTTWGNPSEENILKLADRIQNTGINYLVMDDGWFNDDPGCQQGLGDWNISKTIYPNGFKNLHRNLSEQGFVSGVWFELENCTQGSEIYEKTEHLLKRDGHVLQAGERRFLDFRDPWVHEYLDRKVIQMLKENEIKYIKTDYNDTIGIGCDGCDSQAEGLRQHLEGVQQFYRRMLDEIPELKIEICASGGHRLEPSWMNLASMGGFSDSHEGLDIPIIAANTQMMIPARKNQVWAVLRKEDSLSRIIYSVAATFLGRMCLSGDIHALSADQFQATQSGIDMYHKIKHIVASGNSRRYGTQHQSYTQPKGWQTVIRSSQDQSGAFAVFHAFADAPDRIEIPAPANGKVDSCCKDECLSIEAIDQKIVISGIKPFTAAVISFS